MEQNIREKAQELVNAVKSGLLKPMYDGLKKSNADGKSEILAKLDSIEFHILEMEEQQDALIEALKNLKWDD